MAWVERTFLQAELLFLTRRLNQQPEAFCAIVSRMSEVHGRLLCLDTWPTGFDAVSRWLAGH